MSRYNSNVTLPVGRTEWHLYELGGNRFPSALPAGSHRLYGGADNSQAARAIRAGAGAYRAGDRSIAPNAEGAPRPQDTDDGVFATAPVRFGPQLARKTLEARLATDRDLHPVGHHCVHTHYRLYGRMAAAPPCNHWACVWRLDFDDRPDLRDSSVSPARRRPPAQTDHRGGEPLQQRYCGSLVYRSAWHGRRFKDFVFGGDSAVCAVGRGRRAAGNGHRPAGITRSLRAERPSYRDYAYHSSGLRLVPYCGSNRRLRR